MHKELKNEFIRHSTLIFHPLCTIPIENFHPNRNFFLLKCIFQHPARDSQRDEFLPLFFP